MAYAAFVIEICIQHDILDTTKTGEDGAMTGTRKVFRVILTVLAAAAVLLAAFLIFLTVTEYRPADTERINVAGSAAVRPEETVRLMT